MSHLGKRLSAFIDGELSAARRDQVAAHLARCEPCRLEMLALRAIKRRMQALGETTATDALTSRLMALAAGDSQPAGAAPLGPVMGGPPGRPGGPRRFPARSLAAGVLALGASLSATAFLLGGGQPAPGPKVTPAVDVFIVTHAITTGPAPAAPADLGPARAGTAQAAPAATARAASPATASSAAPAPQPAAASPSGAPDRATPTR